MFYKWLSCPATPFGTWHSDWHMCVISIVTENEYGFQTNASTDKCKGFEGNAILKAHQGEDGFHESRDNMYMKNKFVMVLVGFNELTILVNNVDICGVVQAEACCHNLLCTQFNLTTELVEMENYNDWPVPSHQTRHIIRKITSVWQVVRVWLSMAGVMDVVPPCHHLISEPCLSQWSLSPHISANISTVQLSYSQYVVPIQCIAQVRRLQSFVYKLRKCTNWRLSIVVICLSPLKLQCHVTMLNPNTQLCSFFPPC